MADEAAKKVNEEEAAEQTPLTEVAEGTELEASAPEAGGDDGKGGSKEEKRDRNLNLIMDIPLKVTVELGRTRMVVSELLNLGQGSVVELSKLAGEPMEVLVNNKLVARGEAVVVNEKFGVRLTDIISPTERVEQLGS